GQELADAEKRLEAAENERAGTSDRLEEAHLRHRIGELSEEEWDRQRLELEEAAETAHDVERESAGHVTRLRELLVQLGDSDLAQLEAGDAAPLEDSDLPRLEEREGAEWADAPLPLLPGIEEFGAVTETSDLAESTDTEGFLADIDRVLSDGEDASAEGEEASTAGAERGPDGEAEADTSPRPGLKCPECGYTNDISAWFCGVCGADIG
ncbi:MAG TPA: hypothetical protein VMN39_03745, partial [Longimicrobiaceae bacterium]|nr:hypothetical protein [Longimicrobiaceae bacterium]